MAETRASLVAHNRVLLSSFMEQTAQGGNLVICLTHAKRTDVEGPTVTGTILSGLDHCFDWDLWPPDLAPHNKSGRVSSYGATPTEVVDALQICFSGGLSAARVLVEGFERGTACCFGQKARGVARVLGVGSTAVGQYAPTLRNWRAGQMEESESLEEFESLEESESPLDEEEGLDETVADEVLAALDNEDQASGSSKNYDDFMERFGASSAPYPSLWIIRSYREWAARVLLGAHRQLGLLFDCGCVELLVRKATRAAADRRNTEPGIFDERSRIAIERWTKFTPEARSRIAIKRWTKFTPEARSRIAIERWTKFTPEERSRIMGERWDAKTDEQKAAQRLQLRQAWDNKTEDEVSEIYRRAGESISQTAWSKTQEERSIPSRNRWAGVSTEDRRSHMSAAQASRTREERAETTRNARSLLTAEEKTEMGKRAAKKLTAEQRRKRSQDGNDTLTPDQKKTRAEKGVQKRADVFEQRRKNTEALAARCAALEAQLRTLIDEGVPDELREETDAALAALLAAARAARSVKTSKKAAELAVAALPRAESAISALSQTQGAAEISH
jgi:hypothetical protein